MSGAAKAKSINVGQIRTFSLNGQLVETAFFKEPVAGAINVYRLGLEGDAQADLRVHGGPSKAVYFYPVEHYEVWEKALGLGPLAPGSFGENVTSEGLTESDLYVGDVIRIGTALLQVLQPRSPCYKLQLKFQRPDMVRLFVHQNLPGWYASVLEKGRLAAGDPIEVISRAPEKISVADIWHYSFITEADEEMRQRIGKLELLPTYWKEQITGRQLA